MMDKKLATLAVCFIIVASLIPKPVNAGIISDIIGKIKDFFIEKNPLKDIFFTPSSRNEEVNLIFYPKSISLEVKEPVRIVDEDINITGFKGNLGIDIESDKMTLKQKDAGLIIESKIKNAVISDINIDKLELTGMEMEIRKGRWNESSNNGSVAIYNFLGKVLASKESVTLIGNATRMKRF